MGVALVMEIVETKVLVSTILVTDCCQLLVLKKAGHLVAQLKECTGPSVLGEFATTVLQHLHLARLSAFKTRIQDKRILCTISTTHTHTHTHTHTCTHTHITDPTTHTYTHIHIHHTSYYTHLPAVLCCQIKDNWAMTMLLQESSIDRLSVEQGGHYMKKAHLIHK